MTAAEMEEYTSVVKEANQLLISQKKEIQSKDQQIKDLTELVELASNVQFEQSLDFFSEGNEIWDMAYRSYKEKYSK